MEGEECPSQHPEHPQDSTLKASALHLKMLTNSFASYHPTRKFSSGTSLLQGHSRCLHSGTQRLSYRHWRN
ncbi:hypothetical protein E2C01_004082 [Portunus trituberculatus]|uniref:Uncharacterized protein n=1 Tax=Portunus trituberculatus TaxID=210409 RepID=A0A5B7CT11_PORTR|nr:hypothetical protein [Portunus trituberculatus]